MRTTGQRCGPTRRRHASTGRFGRVALAALAAACVGTGATEDAIAAPSNGILPGPRVTTGTGTNLYTAVAHGDVVYMAGTFGDLGYRAGGLAVVDRQTGALDGASIELVGADDGLSATAGRVVPDGQGGAYVLSGVDAGSQQSFGGTGGVAQPWLLRVDADGRFDTRFRPQLDGNVDALAVAGDGTLYIGGAFRSVGGAPRSGLARIDAATGAVDRWAPALARTSDASAPTVTQLALDADRVYVAGTFQRVGAADRAGVAAISRQDGGAASWQPAGVSGADAAIDLVRDGTALYLVDGADVVRVSTATAEVRALGLDPRPDLAGDEILDFALAGNGEAYVAGRFTTIAGQTRQRIARIDLETGADDGWAPPSTDGPVAAIALDGDDLYAAGDFTQVAGVDRCGAAAVDVAAVSTPLAWNPRPRDRFAAGTPECSTSGVTDVAVSGDLALLAGTLTRVNTEPREGLGAIDLRQDLILPWAPSATAGGGDGTPTAPVVDMHVTEDGEHIYLGGLFDDVNGRARAGTAKLTTAGAADTGAAVDAAYDPAPDGPVWALAASPDDATVYLGGQFSSAGGASRANFAAVDAADGRPRTWTADTDDLVNDVVVGADDGAIYLGGPFANVAGQARRNLAAVDGGDGALLPWDPQLDAGGSWYSLAIDGRTLYVSGAFDGTIGGRARTGLAALSRDDATATGWGPRTNLSQGAISVGADGAVYVGGGGSAGAGFTVDGVARNGAASFDPTGALTSWAPTFAGPLLLDTRVVPVGERVLVARSADQTTPLQGVSQHGFAIYETAVAPTLQTAPQIAGRPVVGEVLRCGAGAYAGSRPLTRSYAWLRDGAPIAGETGVQYTAQAADDGRGIACAETVANPAASLTTESAEVSVVLGPPVNTFPPQVDGDPRVGMTLTCASGAWDNSPALAYRWRRGGADIPGATASTYTPVDADLGASLDCVVSATNAAGSVEAISAPVVVQARRTDDHRDRDRDVVPPPPPDTPPGTPPNTPPNTPPSTPPNTPPSGRQPRATPIAIRGARARLDRRRGRATVTLRAPRAGRIAITLTARRGRRTIVVGRRSLTVRRAGRVTVRVRLTRAGARALRRRGGVTVRATLL